MSSTTAIPSKLRMGTFRPAQLFPWTKVRVDDFLDSAARRRIRRENYVDVNEASADNGATPTCSRPASYRLARPRCHATREMRQTWLYRYGKPCTIRCKNCQCTSFARRWRCQCKRAWVACTVHRADGFLCKGQLEPRRSNVQQQEPMHLPYPKRRRQIQPIVDLSCTLALPLALPLFPPVTSTSSSSSSTTNIMEGRSSGVVGSN